MMRDAVSPFRDKLWNLFREHAAGMDGADTGISIAGFSTARANDKIGIGLAALRISDSAKALDDDFVQFRS